MAPSLDSSNEAAASCSFEGPEKKLEVSFTPVPGNKLGLRAFTREQWQYVLNFAECTIVGVVRNDFCDSYLLSESSLFVYPYKLMVKTCGSTKLLNTVSVLMQYAAQIDSAVATLLFCRKNYMYPHLQPPVHRSFNAERAYLDKYFEGHGQIIGPADGEHWCVYYTDLTNGAAGQSSRREEQTLEIMMLDLDREVMAQFMDNESGEKCARELTIKSGIMEALLGADQVDDYFFSPCGYSVNALKDDAYFTIHVTPEEEGSFVSYETNIRLPSYEHVCRLIIETFKPGKFSIALFQGEDCAGKDFFLPSMLFDGYEKHVCSAVEGDWANCIRFANFVAE